jgi:hypothetical protein
MPSRLPNPFHAPHRRTPSCRAATALLLGALALTGPTAVLGTTAARALELRGSTTFTSPPWKAELRSYNTNVGEANVEHYLTLVLSPEAGAALGRLSLQQIRGADSDFLSRLSRARAFLGRPRREGPAVPVQLHFDGGERALQLTFPAPVPPGSTITVALRAWRNPWVADTYLFQVVAWPAGENPVSAPVGTATLRIYSPAEWF